LYPDLEPKERAAKLVNHAEWGIREIHRRDKNGTLDFSEFCRLRADEDVVNKEETE
jgi:hypothetical protein